MEKISIIRIRKKLSSLHVDYNAFTFLEKTGEDTIVLTITSRFLHDDDANLVLAILDEEYYIERMSSTPEEYKLTLRR
ncbi:MAG: hypothetical protein LBV74_02115 [Tannerella sp.]|jgi:hypothetical protein|nr:hypothetical protein [Tannerella sp.]